MKYNRLFFIETLHMKTYILENKQPVAEPDIIQWCEWMASENCVVAKDTVTIKDTITIKIAGQNVGKIEISTVFLGVDYSRTETPILFETMIFGGPLDQQCERCSTYGEALIMHKLMYERVRVATLQMDF